MTEIFEESHLYYNEDEEERDDYYNDYLTKNKLLALNATDLVVNQSYTFGPLSASEQETVDSVYDNYSMQFRTLFVSAACNYSISPSVCGRSRSASGRGASCSRPAAVNRLEPPRCARGVIRIGLQKSADRRA